MSTSYPSEVYSFLTHSLCRSVGRRLQATADEMLHDEMQHTENGPCSAPSPAGCALAKGSGSSRIIKQNKPR